MKRERYGRWGVHELWLVDTKACLVRAYRRSAPGPDAFDVELVVPAGEALTSPLLPGFSLDVAELFPTTPDGA